MPPRSARPWRALDHRDYRLYFAGMLLSQIGTWMQRVAQVWLVLDLTDSAAALAAVSIFSNLPVLALSLFAGAIADRVPRRPLLLGIAALQTTHAAVLGGLVLSGQIQVWHVYVLALSLGLLDAFEKPARRAMIATSVPAHDLASAVGLTSSIFATARIVGPSLGGVAVAYFGIGWGFLLNAVSFLAVMLALTLMRIGQTRSSKAPDSEKVGTAVVAGLSYVKGRPALILPLIIQAFLGTFGYNLGIAIPLLARYEFGSDAAGLGMLQTGVGVGALCGAIFAASRVSAGPGSVLIGAAGFGVLLGMVSFAPTLPTAIGLLALLGLASVIYDSSTQTVLQLGAGDEYRGRVLSLNFLLHSGSTPVGAAITGGLATFWGIRPTLLFEAMLCLTGAAIGAIYLRHKRAPFGEWAKECAEEEESTEAAN